MLSKYTRIILILTAWTVFTACQVKNVPIEASSENDGLVFVYLQPLSQDAETLRFEVTDVKAMSADGDDQALSLSLADIRGNELKRQRLLAHGRIPAGEYTGISCRIKRASFKGGDAEADLLVPDRPVQTPVFFRVNRRSPVVLTLSLRYGESVKTGFGFNPVFSAFIPDHPLTGVTGYVADAASDSIAVFDKNKMQVLGALATGTGPRMIAFDRISQRAYTALAGDDAVEIINIADGRTIEKIRLNSGDAPQELALTPDGAVLLVVNSGSDSVSFFDARSFRELGRVQVGKGPQSVLLNRNAQRAYVFNTLSGSISVLDVPYRALVSTISTEPEPVRGQFNRQGDRLYVISRRSPYLLVLDAVSLSVIRREFVGMGISAIKVDPRTDLFYLAMRHDPAIGVYDPYSFSRGDSIAVGGTAVSMAIDGEENNLYVAIPERRVVSVVNLVSRKIISEFDVSDAPAWVAVMGER